MDSERSAPQPAIPPAIQVTDLYQTLGGAEVLRGVNLTVPRGTTCVLLGVSGSGKTVLVKHLIGLMRPERGRVCIDGEDLATLDGDGLARVRRKMGILFQSNALLDSLTVFENVAFPLRELTDKSEAEIAEIVRRKLGLVRLNDAEALFPGQLSGGMQKRVAFARAVVLDPQILFYDEPTAGLDPLTTRSVADVIITGKKELGASALAIIADLPSAFRVADSLALLDGGRIVEQGPPETFRRSRHPAVQAFLRTWLAREGQQRQPSA